MPESPLMKPIHLALVTLAFPLVLAGCGSSAPAPKNVAPIPATLSSPEISPQLAAMAREVRAAPSASAAAALSTRGIRVNHQGEIQVYIYVKHLNSGVKASIAQAGATDIRPSQPLGLYQAWVTPQAMAQLTTLAAVYKVTPPIYAYTRGGQIH